ncbi:hypothetical protein ACQ4PT_050430 [Festuca glaucescens]
MGSLIGLVNRIQQACTVLGDYGGRRRGSLWNSLPSVAVVGGQSSGKSSVLESIVGRDFLPRGSAPQDGGRTEYAEFLHLPRKRFTDFAAVRQEISDHTDRITGKSKAISNKPIQLSIYSPHVVNLTLIDLPGLTKVAVEGQPESIVQDIETWSGLMLTRTFGVVTKLDLMDKGTNAVDVLEGRSYRLQHPWVGVVNRSQADINKSVDMLAARRKEQEYFQSSPDYGHLAHKMGAEYLAKLLSEHLEAVIKAKIPSIIAMINKTVDEIEAELDRLGRPIGGDAGVHLVLKELVRRSIAATEELKRFPTLQSDIAAAANESLERFREDGRKTVIRLVDMEASYLTVEFFRKLPTEPDKGANNNTPANDRYQDNHLRRIGSNVSSYIGMVCDTLRNTIPKAVVHCQVKEAKRNLLNRFYAHVGSKEKKQLSAMLDEDPGLMEKRDSLVKKLELYKSARNEIDSVAWK